MEKKQILIAVDKFKGSLTSLEAAQAIQRGIEESCLQECDFRIVEIADGGDGSLQVLKKRLNSAQTLGIAVHDPVGRVVESEILLYEQSTVSSATPVKCAFIEMAKISGLEMLLKGQRNPLRTSTFGMGEAILAAAEEGVEQITLSIGGSATNDGGAGMLQALGYRFYDKGGKEIATPVCGGDLGCIASIMAPCGSEAGRSISNKLSGIKFNVICDVTNPLLGENGATAVYGPQKGADGNALEILESGLANYAAVANKCGFGRVEPYSAGAVSAAVADFRDYPGAGAAGGVGYAGLAFLGAELIPGWKFFAEVTSLEESVQWADLVVTGEGCLDSQSMSGKVVNGVVNLAEKYNKRVVIFCGVSKLGQEESGTLECHSIASLGYPLEVCMSDAAKLLQQLAMESFAVKK